MTNNEDRGGFIAYNPQSIRLMGLITLKSQLKLQMRTGMRMKAYNPRAYTRTLPGCPKTMDFEKLIAFVEGLIEAQAEDPRARFERI